MPEMLLSTKGQKLVFACQPPQDIITDDLTLVIRILHAHLTSAYQEQHKKLPTMLYDSNMGSTKALSRKHNAAFATGTATRLMRRMNFAIERY